MESTNISEQTMITSLKAAEENLAALTPNLLHEINCLKRPPPACELVLQGVGVLLNPSKKKFEWADAKKMTGNSQFLSTLWNFDKDTISDDQLARLTAILSNDECQVKRVGQVSSVCQTICLWLRAMADYANFRRQSTQ